MPMHVPAIASLILATVLVCPACSEPDAEPAPEPEAETEPEASAPADQSALFGEYLRIVCGTGCGGLSGRIRFEAPECSLQAGCRTSFVAAIPVDAFEQRAGSLPTQTSEEPFTVSFDAEQPTVGMLDGERVVVARGTLNIEPPIWERTLGDYEISERADEAIEAFFAGWLRP